MAKIRLAFDPERVTIGDLVKMEEGIESALEMRTFLTKFLVDEKGKAITDKKAIEMLNKLTVSEVLDSISSLSEMAKDEIVPPPQGGS